MTAINNSSGLVKDDCSEIVGESAAIVELKKTLAKVAPTDATVLIVGETGTGKELIAKAIHSKSKRSKNHFTALNCSALTPSVLESELFGHEKGAFTGADRLKHGLFEVADKGTIFLDEIGTATADTQAKLLRVLQEKVVRRVGAAEDTQVDVRIIAATNENLEEAVRKGTFRDDLYYRLKVYPIATTPIRERGEDVILLAEHFLAMFAQKYTVPLSAFSSFALERIRRYSWPGNARELSNVVERSVIDSSGLQAGGFLDVPILDSGTGDPAPTRTTTISDQVFEDLMNGRIPLLGFERSADMLGAVAQDLVNGVARGFDHFLQTDDGAKALHNFTEAHLLERLGLPRRKSGSEAFLKQALRRQLLEILRRKRKESSP